MTSDQKPRVLGRHFGKTVSHLSFKALPTTVLSGRAHLHAAKYLYCRGSQFGLGTEPPYPCLGLSPRFLLLDTRIEGARGPPSWILPLHIFPFPALCPIALARFRLVSPYRCNPARGELVSDTQFPCPKILFPCISATPGLKKQKTGIRASWKLDVLNPESTNL